ncbi:Unknown protein sequence [Pseudomonas amygdali pv. lachrymans]|uniref:Uncharacterized protein n=1 Tax=Pseudomonas amygdali pv. lachrymans TaxID=53707 RepID=A0ABR5KRC1_PSEAV|nr:Unknown protein sequence [Pseudomonas amygdali pv. lachrymans]
MALPAGEFDTGQAILDPHLVLVDEVDLIWSERWPNKVWAIVE